LKRFENVISISGNLFKFAKSGIVQIRESEAESKKTTTTTTTTTNSQHNQYQDVFFFFF